ncbi:hypothetical protein [Dongia deserti]|uniref:hypothetical protein n=1 Tax=Dongia deserti TaxID=2268030 RepID=UPI000E657F4C|nr:hypothetical protein [Dongia deserti]
MSDYTRLNRGFVNWQGQRVFVPWFGAPRIVPSAQEETRVLKMRYRMDIITASTLILFFVAARSIGDSDVLAVATGAAIASGLSALGCGMLLEHCWVRDWLPLTTAWSSRIRFMLSYFRTLPILDRVKELGWGALGGAICGKALYSMLLAPGEGWREYWFVVSPMLIGFSVLTFLAARHAVLALFSLPPRAGTARSA